ncbi:MAG: SpoIID/LytB domain-containing protein [Bacillota bacterium]
MYCRSNRVRLYLAIVVGISVLALGQTVLGGTLPSEMRVGLSYGKDAWPTASFSSSTGLALGMDRASQPLWTSTPNQTIRLVGDGSRLEVGRIASLSEANQLLSRLTSARINASIFHQPDGSWAVRAGQSSSSEGLAALKSALTAKGFISMKEIGGYRLQIEESYASRAELERRVTDLRSQGIPSYPAYENGWHLWVGDNAPTELDGLRALVEKALPGAKTTVVNPNIDRIVALDQAGEVVLIYSSQVPVSVSDAITSQRADNYRVEIGPYVNVLAANQAQQQLSGLGYAVYRVKTGGGVAFWIGDGWELSSAQAVEKDLRAKGFPVARLVGPYRLVSLTSFPSRETAQSRAGQLREKGLETTILYENGWRVAVGNAATSGERDALRTALVHAAGLEPYVEREIDGGRMQVFDSSGNLLALLQAPDERPSALRLWAIGDGAVYSEEKGDRYPGLFEFRRYYHGGLTVINRVAIEDYVAGVAAKEMYPDWPLEALKAQAVASRSYATMKIGNVAFSQWGCDVDDTTSTQVYTGLKRAGLPNIKTAVNQTAGQYVWYNDQIANTYFHSDGGGHTENSENVWSAVVPYIRGVPEPFPSDGPNATWQESMTGEEIRQALLGSGRKDVGTITNLIVEQTGVSGAPVRLRVVGTAGEELLLKDDPRGVFGFLSNNFTITQPGTAVSYYARGESGTSAPLNPSTAYVIGGSGKTALSMASQPAIRGSDSVSSMVTNASDKFVFNGRGFGHGLGMSQWGAKAMADHGYTYIQILQHYYQGTVVK